MMVCYTYINYFFPFSFLFFFFFPSLKPVLAQGCYCFGWGKKWGVCDRKKTLWSLACKYIVRRLYKLPLSKCILFCLVCVYGHNKHRHICCIKKNDRTFSRLLLLPLSYICWTIKFMCWTIKFMCILRF